MNTSEHSPLFRFGAGVAAAGLIAVGLLGAASPALAVQPLAAITPADMLPASVETLPSFPAELTAAQLAVIAETQSDAEIARVIALAGPDQWVQIYADSETFEYLAAVLIDAPPSPFFVDPTFGSTGHE